MTLAARQIVGALWVFLVLLVGCEPGAQEVQITAQDYRFVPTLIRLQADRPLTLSIINAGREPHEFTSRLLTDPDVEILSRRNQRGQPKEEALRVLPGRAVRVTVKAPPGTYLFRCRIRGHAGMRGTMIVESPPERPVGL